MYLGVTINTILTFAENLRTATKIASIRVGQLIRLMANTRVPRPQARRLLISTIHLFLLCGAEVWADAMRVKKYRHGMEVVQRRGALRIASSYRTVSRPVVLVIANVVPIDLLAFERKRTYDRIRDMRHRGGTRKQPRYVATRVDGRDGRTVDAQTDFVDIRMGKK